MKDEEEEEDKEEEEAEKAWRGRRPAPLQLQAVPNPLSAARAAESVCTPMQPAICRSVSASLSRFVFSSSSYLRVCCSAVPRLFA